MLGTFPDNSFYSVFQHKASARTGPYLIALHDVSKRFERADADAVSRVSFTVDGGETVVLLGSSGCGKTTTLKMINRLIRPSAGRIVIGGRDAAEMDVLQLRRSIGYVFQDIGLFPHMTVSQNVEIVPRLLGWPTARRRERSRALLGLVGLDADEHADRMPAQLSGGQQQRVGIARALASDPDHLLMDEPFGALDAVTRDQLQSELVRIKTELGKTIVFVTHDLFEALRLGDRIGVMNAGRLEQIGTRHELLHDPKTAFVEELFGHARRQAALLEEAHA